MEGGGSGVLLAACLLMCPCKKPERRVSERKLT